MTHVSLAVSPALLAAQAQLQAIRQKLGITPSVPSVSTPAPTAWSEIAEQLPAHLGWGSLSAETLAKHKPAPAPAEPSTPAPIPTPDAPQSPQTLRLYPTVAMACLKAEQTAPARIWLLSRLLDEDGCGWLSLTAVRHAFTSPKSDYRLCGKRQLRNLLHAGEGIFWQRDGERLWLRSVRRVAEALGIPRLTGQPIALPVSTLLASMQTVRAHFYASFHSGRPDRPIARETLTAVSGLSHDSQRRYEKATGVTATVNYAIGNKATKENKENTYWRYGHAAFELTDKKGKQGKARVTYMAWQLPNSYSAIHETSNKGNQRRINRQLTDLSMKGMTGNGGWQAKRFYDDGKSAARIYNRRDHEQTIYWSYLGQRRRQKVWYSLDPQ